MSQHNELLNGWFGRCGRSGLKLPAISLGCWHSFGAPGTGSAGGAVAKLQQPANLGPFLFGR
jgi:aryl-alcohol dehydrogenase-like predicted oxidoreductase